jgi:hypothetical protein
LGVDLIPMSDQTHLTQTQAYLAMFEFLRRYYAETNSDDVGSLLGGMSLLDDGSPADAAYWPDWLASVAVVMRAESSPEGYRAADFKLEKQ